MKRNASNVLRILLVAAVPIIGCNPQEAPADALTTASLKTWDEVKQSTPTQATRPPEPILVIDKGGSKCFKVYTVFPQEFRLPNGQAYGIRDCSDDCGTPIQCPSWSEDVRSDWANRSKAKNKTNDQATPSDAAPSPDAPGDAQEAKGAITPTVGDGSAQEEQKQWPSNLGPPPTREPQPENPPSP